MRRPSQRRLAGGRRLVVFELRRQQGQRIVRQGNHRAIGTMQDRQRLAPVALAREQPVAQMVLDLSVPGVAGLQPGDRGRLGRCRRQAVEGRRIDDRAVALPCLVVHVAAASHHADDRQVERARKGVIAAVMSGHGHDGALAVAHQHVVGDPDRQLGPISRIDRVTAGEHAGLARRARSDAFALTLARTRFDIGHHRGRAGRRRRSSRTSGCSGASTQ